MLEADFTAHSQLYSDDVRTLVGHQAAFDNISMLQEIGNSNAQWWSKHLMLALDGGAGGWCQIGLRQLSGMLILVFARSRLKDVVGEVSLALD